MQIRRVVTAFIRSDGEILLLKRSGRVGTHRGRWAGVSGYIEGGEEPVDRVFREVSEELGLSGGEVELERASDPLGVPELKEGILWIVYPHLLRSRSRGVRIDWEHTEHRWVSLEEMYRYRTVPGLFEALQKVHPSPVEDRETVKDLQRIESDTAHGAGWLARKALRALKHASDRRVSETVEDHLAYTSSLAVRMMGLRLNMASIGNSVGLLLYRACERAKEAEDVEAFKLSVREEAERIVKASWRAVEKVAEEVSKLISKKMSVLTHSHSSTVMESLKYAVEQGADLTVMATESRPLLEGRAAAEELSKYGIPVTVISDASSGHFVEEADLVLVGADSVLADGRLVNKAGTYLIALAAKDHHVPFTVACEESKFNLRSLFVDIPLEERSASELWPGSPADISVRNLYFDVTPPPLITHIITERKAYRPSEVVEAFEEALKHRYIV